MFWVVAPPFFAVLGLWSYWRDRSLPEARFALVLCGVSVLFLCCYFYQGTRFMAAPASLPLRRFTNSPMSGGRVADSIANRARFSAGGAATEPIPHGVTIEITSHLDPRPRPDNIAAAGGFRCKFVRNLAARIRGVMGIDEMRRELAELRTLIVQEQITPKLAELHSLIVQNRIAPKMNPANKVSQLVLLNQYQTLVRGRQPLPSWEDVEFRAFSQGGRRRASYFFIFARQKKPAPLCRDGKRLRHRMHTRNSHCQSRVERGLLTGTRSSSSEAMPLPQLRGHILLSSHARVCLDHLTTSM